MGDEKTGGDGPLSGGKKAPEVEQIIVSRIDVGNVKGSLKLPKRGFFYHLGNLVGVRPVDWAETFDEVDLRRCVFAAHKALLDDIEHAKNEIAAVDIFVEKAQQYLEAKSRQCLVFAFCCGVMLALLLAADWYYLTEVVTISGFFSNLYPLDRSGTTPEFNGYIFSMWVLRGAALSGISGGAIYFLASLVRAFLHEATVVWNRRHSVRLGRLFIYLKFAGVDDFDLRKMRNSITINDIEQAFGWNLETSTAFRDIKPELMAKGSPADPTRLVEAAAKLVEASRQQDR